MTGMQDAELAALAQAGDREAFGELVARYAAQARRLARTILGDPDDADDAAQDGFLSALKHLGRFDPARPFGPWLMRIVANAAGDRRRRRRVREVQPLSPVGCGNGPSAFQRGAAYSLRSPARAAADGSGAV
jgi:RNA polymerase sigma-70 factor (ECF subfamily)